MVIVIMANIGYENIKNKKSLKYHLESMHSRSNTGFIKKGHRKHNVLQCLEKGCTCKFYDKKLFISHLKYDHCIDFDVHRLKFNSEDEFLTWKEDFEQENNSRYVLVNGCRTLLYGKKLSYYFCNRSTYFTNKSKGITPNKVKGLCTATIKEIKNKDDFIEVLLCATHYGHDISTEDMKMTKCERGEITECIKQGNHLYFVINTARAKVSDSLGRVHNLLNRKDINNIERKLGIRFPDFIKYRTINDLRTDTRILKLQHTSDKPVLFYKPKNVACENFEPNDVMLIFMTQNKNN
ncbi:hypothetical protein AGLY_001886 [Aphis glycines]|uniref:C2H2-type domain-containing protein n=1 Tax=Aphis glycines TaxID=307491 RepID=A0A6G0U464_APHGL|nr:hypothetical protein AGLY_001886 [Aphis glycines]